MALFSNFCNICYKIDNGSLKNITEDNKRHLNDILNTFVGHADIIKCNAIYLCQLCCEELTRFNKFREMCLSNLIHFRQRYINMKLELQDDDACAVQNTLQKFVYEVLRKSALEKSNCSVSISMDCHGNIKSPADVNEDRLVFNRQVTNLQLETNECDIDGAWSEVSVTNRVTGCNESRVAVTNEEDMKNEMLTLSENIRLEKFERESDGDFGVTYTNNVNESNTLQIEFMKEEYDLKSERENSDTVNFTLKNDENESDEHANFDVNVPVVYNSGGRVSSKIASTKVELNVKQENSASKGLELQTMEDGFGDGLNVSFEFVNVCTIVKTEEREHRNVKSEDAKGGMKLGLVSDNESTASIINTHPSRVDVREDRNGRSPTAAHKRVHSGAKPHTCVVCNQSFRTRSYLVTHERIHSGGRSFKCNVCNKSFTRSHHLTSHERTHTGDRPYICTVCNKAFTDPSNLIRHKRSHSDDRPYKCTLCIKAFTDPSTLRRHKRTHSGDRPYKCTVCNKAFTQSDALTAHNRTHSGDRPYKCTVCHKAFTHSSNLISHERIHSGDRPYKCSVCNKAFAQAGTLIRHKQIHPL